MHYPAEANKLSVVDAAGTFLALRKGNPVARRVRKAKDLSEGAGCRTGGKW